MTNANRARRESSGVFTKHAGKTGELPEPGWASLVLSGQPGREPDPHYFNCRSQHRPHVVVDPARGFVTSPRVLMSPIRQFLASTGGLRGGEIRAPWSGRLCDSTPSPEPPRPDPHFRPVSPPRPERKKIVAEAPSTYCVGLFFHDKCVVYKQRGRA